MKRLILFFLLFVLLLPLCGCAAKSPAPAADDLTPLLEDISAGVHPGTAGGFLRVAK